VRAVAVIKLSRKKGIPSEGGGVSGSDLIFIHRLLMAYRVFVGVMGVVGGWGVGGERGVGGWWVGQPST